MKKIIYLILILMCITGCNKNDTISDITFTNIEDCVHKPTLLTSYNGINIYTYCIEDIKVNINNKQIDLKKYIKRNENAIENIIEFMPLTYSDSATMTIYKGGKYETDKDNAITLLKCYSSTGNEDVYIGNGKMGYKKNFCKDNNYTFVRTYYLENIENNYDGSFVKNSFKVELKDFKENVETVILNDLFTITLGEDKYYEFEFMLNEEITKIEDNIKSVFDNSTIVEIRETNKDIKNQNNDEQFIK